MFNFEGYNLSDEEEIEIMYKLMRIVEEVSDALKTYACAPEEFLSPPAWQVEELKEKFQRLIDKNGWNLYLQDPLVYFLLKFLVQSMRQVSIEKARMEREDVSGCGLGGGCNR